MKLALNCFLREGIIVAPRGQLALTEKGYAVTGVISTMIEAKMRHLRFAGGENDLCLDQELPIPHDLLVVHPDVKPPAHNIDMSR